LYVEENTETRLLRGWRAGDRQAGDLLLRRYARVLKSFFARRRSSNVDDLVQRTLLACTVSMHRFEGRSSFKTYLLGIAHRQFLMNLRADGLVLKEGEDESTPAEESPSQLTLLNQEHRILAFALAKISTESLLILRMFYWNDSSVEEIARLLVIRPGTVKSRLSRTRALLKELMLKMAPETTNPDALVEQLLTSGLSETKLIAKFYPPA
jgi:RNA polymerase sigma-70 factor (ECF subfamily)